MRLHLVYSCIGCFRAAKITWAGDTCGGAALSQPSFRTQWPEFYPDNARVWKCQCTHAYLWTSSLSESISSLTMQQPLLFHPLLKMPRCLLSSQLTLEELLLCTAVWGFTPFQDPRLWHSTAMQYLMCGILHLHCAQVHKCAVKQSMYCTWGWLKFPIGAWSLEIMYLSP